MTQVESARLELNRVVPGFTLSDLDGHPVSPWDYKQRANLLIAFLDLGNCEDCSDYLRQLADNHGSYRELETQVLVITPSLPDQFQGKIQGTPLPFPVLVDRDGRVSGLYLGEGQGSHPGGTVFVTDRYGALRAELAGEGGGHLPQQKEIEDWLNLIEMECPECGPGGD